MSVWACRKPLLWFCFAWTRHFDKLSVTIACLIVFGLSELFCLFYEDTMRITLVSLSLSKTFALALFYLNEALRQAQCDSCLFNCIWFKRVVLSFFMKIQSELPLSVWVCRRPFYKETTIVIPEPYCIKPAYLILTKHTPPYLSKKSSWWIFKLIRTSCATDADELTNWCWWVVQLIRTFLRPCVY